LTQGFPIPLIKELVSGLWIYLTIFEESLPEDVLVAAEVDGREVPQDSCDFLEV